MGLFGYLPSDVEDKTAFLAVAIYGDGFREGAGASVRIESYLDLSFLSRSDRRFGPFRGGATARGDYTGNHQRFVARVRNDERVRYIPIGLFDGSEIVAGLLGGDNRFPLREGGSYRE